MRSTLKHKVIGSAASMYIVSTKYSPASFSIKSLLPKQQHQYNPPLCAQFRNRIKITIEHIQRVYEI